MSENLYKILIYILKYYLGNVHSWTALLKILVLQNTFKIVVPLFGAAYAASNMI